MSDKITKQPEEKTENISLDGETLEQLSAEYRSGISDVYDSRKRLASEREAMTDEELEASLEAELEAALVDALAHPVRTEIISSDKD